MEHKVTVQTIEDDVIYVSSTDPKGPTQHFLSLDEAKTWAANSTLLSDEERACLEYRIAIDDFNKDAIKAINELKEPPPDWIFSHYPDKMHAYTMRNGKNAYVYHKVKGHNCPLIGIDENGYNRSWTIYGQYLGDTKSPYDIIREDTGNAS